MTSKFVDKSFLVYSVLKCQPWTMKRESPIKSDFDDGACVGRLNFTSWVPYKGVVTPSPLDFVTILIARKIIAETP